VVAATDCGAPWVHMCANCVWRDGDVAARVVFPLHGAGSILELGYILSGRLWWPRGSSTWGRLRSVPGPPREVFCATKVTDDAVNHDENQRGKLTLPSQFKQIKLRYGSAQLAS
jgi:hypothetical protein